MLMIVEYYLYVCQCCNRMPGELLEATVHLDGGLTSQVHRGRFRRWGIGGDAHTTARLIVDPVR